MAVESNIGVTPGVGSNLDTVLVTTGAGIVHREGVFVGDADNASQRLVITAAGAAKVDGSGVTQPVSISGTVSVSSASLDSTSLYSGTLVAIGVGTQIDTTGYQSVTIQVSNIFSAQAYIEGSNDGSVWDVLMLLPLDDFTIRDNINLQGNYSLKVSTKYIRYNVQSIAGSLDLKMVGRVTKGPDASDLLTMALDPFQNVSIQTTVVNQPVRDSQGRLMQSDAPDPISMIGKVGDIFTIDTQGYNSFNITSFAQTANITTCNDREGTFIALSGTPLAIAAAYVTATTANANFSFPCLARYIRVTVVTAGVAVGYLRAAPWVPGYATPLPVNHAQTAGTATVTAGVAGMQAVGGNIAAGAAPTAAPVLIAGVDNNTTPLTRRLLTDTAGRLIVDGQDFSNTARPIPVNPTASGQYAQPHYEVGVFEGQTMLDLLGQMLFEQRITNQYLFDLNAGIVQSDEPAKFRNDPTIFN